MIEEIRSSLLEFLSSKENNNWIGNSNVRIYVRKSKRYIEGRIQNCLDIATISIDPQFRGKGLFGEIVKAFEQGNPYEYIAIESIVNPRLLEHIRKQEAWKPYMTYEDTFIKKIG
jgi:hypothetical protein